MGSNDNCKPPTCNEGNKLQEYIPVGCCSSCLLGRVCLPRGVSALQGVCAEEVSAKEGGVCIGGMSVYPGECLPRECLPGGVCLGDVSQHALRHFGQNDRQV